MNHRSNKILLRLFFINLIAFSAFLHLNAQFEIELTVLEGAATTTCGDGIFNPNVNPMWGVAVEDEPVVFYSNDDCPTFTPPAPNFVHFSTVVDCVHDLNGGEIFVCLWSFDHDPPAFGNHCNVTKDENRKDCLEVPCGRFVLPQPGKDSIYTFVPSEPNLESSGFIRFRISVSEDLNGRVLATNDHICNAIPIELSTGGAINKMFNNNCTTSIDDPTINAGFTTTNSVWFKFVPGPSRRVNIFVNSDQPAPVGIDPIDPEIAVFYAPTNQCTGALTEVISQNTVSQSESEFLTLECLNPKLTYYILVDGSDADPTGNFSVTVAEKSYPEPTKLDTIICEGDILNLGNKSYANPGTYLDTIVMDDDCINIIETNLIVVKPLTLTLERLDLSRGEGQPGGVMLAGAEGGTGSYAFEWSDGQTNQVANNLLGGEEYCVTVTEKNANCQVIECFIMEYPVPIAATIINDTVNCSSDVTGQLRLTVTAGQTPYQYKVQGIEDPSVIKLGAVTRNDSLLIINDLPVGSYNVSLTNEFTGNSFEAAISAPSPITINLVDKKEVSCFSSCDGMLELAVTGGTGVHTLAWNNGIANGLNPDNICAGEYVVMVTDEKNCMDSAQFTIIEPEPTVLTFSDIQPVTCFGESNGQARVNANELIASILWENGDTTETVTTLSAGINQVMVVTQNGCESSNSIEITQPEMALTAKIDIMENIACGGDTNGVLADASTGGNSQYEYTWSNGSKADFIDNLSAGEYTLIVMDEKGCEDETTVTLAEPIPIDASLKTQDVTCPGGESSGAILIDNPIGGTAPYRFAIENQNFIDNTEITNLHAGTYAVIMQDNNGCEKTFEQIVINSPPELTVELGENRTIKLGNTLELKATTNHKVSYEWFSTDSLNCIDCPSINSRPFEDADYWVRVTDLSTGCIAEDAVSIKVLKVRNIYVPNAFSPNSDGVNEELSIFGGADIDQVLRFEIYARNGSKVYEAHNFDLNNGIGWDGTFNQQRISTDVFVYFAEIRFIDGAVEVFKGDFTLVR